MKLKQILINLVANALKFTKAGSIRLKASSAVRADGTVRVEILVVDTGIGITGQDAQRIFRAFEQLVAGKRAGGTGLGLAISRTYARRMGGDLTVESVLNVGSTFTFDFVAKRERAAADVTAGGARRKVLIVDDLALTGTRSRRCYRSRSSRHAPPRTGPAPSRFTPTGSPIWCSSTCACRR